jgi:preprotein translocase subunit SecA
LFGQLLDSVKNDVTKVLMTVRVQSSEQLEQAAEDMEARAESLTMNYTGAAESSEVTTIAAAAALAVAAAGSEVPRVGRNEPCPCGSGNKYKHCHGKLV